MRDNIEKIEKEMRSWATGYTIHPIEHVIDWADRLKAIREDCNINARVLNLEAWLRTYSSKLSVCEQRVFECGKKADEQDKRMEALETGVRLDNRITDLDERLSKEAGLSIQCDEDLKKRIDALEHRLTCFSSSFECHEHTELQESIQGIRDALKQVKGDHQQRLRYLEEWKQKQIQANGGLVKGLPTLGEADEVVIIPSKSKQEEFGRVIDALGKQPVRATTETVQVFGDVGGLPGVIEIPFTIEAVTSALRKSYAKCEELKRQLSAANVLVFDPKSICKIVEDDWSFGRNAGDHFVHCRSRISEVELPIEFGMSENDMLIALKRAALKAEKQKLISKIDQLIAEALSQ